MNHSQLEQTFRQIGAQFVPDFENFAQRLGRIRAFVFDWDGVFNAGYKGEGTPSPFSEPDSMGTNLWRFAYWLQNGMLPVFAVITGAPNPTAIELATREHWDAVYFKIRDKATAVKHLCQAHQLSPEQVACSFDDINDLGMAEICGLRSLVRRQSSPLYMAFALTHQRCDYITASEGGQHAVRELCELWMGTIGQYEAALQSRIAFDQHYQQYFAQRQQRNTLFFTQNTPEDIIPAMV